MTLRRDSGPQDSLGLKIRGDDSFPVNRGQLCIKGFTAGALLDHPDRMTTPLLRGADGAWRSASWEAALDFTAKRILEIRAAHGAAGLGVFGSGGLTNEKAYLLGKFARLALGTPHIDYNGRYCMASAAAAQDLAFGLDRGLPFPVSDIAKARALLLWGSNCAETLPPIMQWISVQRAGGKLIVADPRLTDTARSAHLHLQLTPGSDLALANGLLHLAIAEEWIDRAYIARRTNGFEAVRRGVLAYHPARVERITGIPLEKMRNAVAWLAHAPSSMLLSGRGPEQQSKGVDTVLAFINLMLALGKVGQPCSGYGCLTGQGNGQGGREHGQKADQLPGYRSIESAVDRAAVAQIWKVDPASLPRKGRTAYELLDSLGQPGGVHGLLVLGSNVAVASPDAQRVASRLRALELLVVCDAFPNETLEYAHVALPVLQWAEEEGTVTNLEGRVLRRRRVVRPPAGAKSDLEILCALARRLGAQEHFDFAGASDVFDELRRASAGGRADYSGITYEKIDRQSGVFWPCPALDHPGSERIFGERFAHADGRARFHVVEHRAAGEEPDADYPLFFTTGRYKEQYNSGAQTRRVPQLIDRCGEPRIELHPRLALRLRVGSGDELIVESRRGRVTFRVAVRAEIRPDTLFAPFHWGGRQAANLLTHAALDPTSRMPEFKICAVRARAIEPSAWRPPEPPAASG
jgi:assimilatory nitrate reductase catalytic subunit